MKQGTVLIPYDEAQAQKVAKIMGESSACATALREMERRRANGEDVHLWWAASTIIVGPVPSSEITQPSL
jgi:hypothetical protein